jgi:hypothetical protein
MNLRWRGLGGNREVPPIEILRLRVHLRDAWGEACPEEEGCTRGKHGFPRESEPKASEESHLPISSS